MKHQRQTIDVEQDTEGWPARVRRGRELHRVDQVLDQWRLQGKWWTRNEERRTYFRVLLRSGAVWDIYHSAGAWWLEKMVD